MDEEQIGQLREVSGTTALICELCGKPSSEVSVVVMERRSSGAPASEMRICPSCRRHLEAGDLLLELDEMEETIPDSR